MRARSLAGLALLTLVLGGCAQSSDKAKEVVFGSFASEPVDHFDVAIQLTWSVDSRGCLLAHSAAEAGPVPVLLPEDTKVNGDSIQAPGKPPVTFTGGTSSGAMRAPLIKLADISPALPESCAGATDVWVVYSVGKASKSDP